MDLFTELCGGGESAIKALVSARTQESVTLDFKRKNNSQTPHFENSDRKTLGKALSAFANSAGGVIVFGIDARKIDKVDCAMECMPISGIAAFASEAQSLVGQLLLPKHDGIRMCAVSCDSDSTKGYLVIEVERSERRPHQSKAKEDGLYYKRAGDSSFPMEHYDIEDAFRRIVAPSLSLRHSLFGMSRSSETTGESFATRILLDITVDEGIARSPFLHILYANNAVVLGQPFELTATGSPLKFSAVSDGSFRFDGSGSDVFHPGISYPTCPLQVTVSRANATKPLFVNGQVLRLASVQIRFRLGAEGTRLEQGVYEIPGAAIADHLGLN